MVKLSKAYLRYEPHGHFGTVTSHSCNTLLSGCGRFVFTGANESIVCWSLKRNEAIFQFDCRDRTDHNQTKILVGVTRLEWLEVGKFLIAGYADGNVRIWEFDAEETADLTSKKAQSVIEESRRRGYFIFGVQKPPTLKVTLHGVAEEVRGARTPKWRKKYDH